MEESTEITPGMRLYFQAAKNGLRPSPRFTVSEWADRFRQLSQRASAEPGVWNTARTPYLREIMDCLSAHSEIQTVVLIKGAQLGGTEAGNNWLGYIIDYAPGPTIAVQPTSDLAKRYSRQRIEPLINESPRLRLRVKPAKSRDAGNTTLSKEFSGGILVMTGANSAVGLRSMPARNLFLDEIDGYPDDVDGEGDPVSLAEARARTFASRKVFKCSTPTIDGRSRIKAAFDNSDQRKYYVPCPHCDEFQKIEWPRIVWPKGKPHEAKLTCMFCGVAIDEFHKTEMLSKGKWLSENPTHPNKKVVGFQISSLYSPLGWFSWGDAAEMFEESKKNPLKLRTFVNTVLGETWKEEGDAPDCEEIYRRREKYQIGTLPDGVLFLTAGADVQKDRIELEIVGWGKDSQSWSIDYIEINGDTSTPEPYLELERILNESFRFASNEGARLPIKILAIDSGYNTQAVYNWARKHPGRVMAIKGSNDQPTILGGGKPVDITYKGQVYRRGVKLWRIGVSLAKVEFYSWLRQKPPLDEGLPYKFGYCHFPEYQLEYFKMLTAEQLRVQKIKGHSVYGWHKVYERNEALDARIYARAAASLVGLDRFEVHNWEELEESIKDLMEEASGEGKSTSNKVVQPTKGGIPVRRSKFWGG